MKEVQIVARETIREFFRKTYDQFAGKPMRVVDMVSSHKGWTWGITLII